MVDYSRLSDRELLENNTADSGKITELISRHMKTVFALAAKYSKSADYDELVSDGMQGLLAAISGYDSAKGEFSVFLSACIENRLKNTAKKSIRHKSMIKGTTDEIIDEIADERPGPEEIAIEKESSEMVLNDMRTNLTALEFECMNGILMGLSYGEIAQRLNIDKKAVDNAVMRARTKLKKFYSR